MAASFSSEMLVPHDLSSPSAKMYGTLQRNVESSPGSVLGRLVGESRRAEDGGRGEQESESSGPEHVDESKWEARVADADAVSDVDEPEVKVSLESPGSV